MTDKTLKEKVDQIAHQVADAVINNEPLSKDTMDSVKLLLQYLALERKITGQPGEEQQGDSFVGFRDRIASAQAQDRN